MPSLFYEFACKDATNTQNEIKALANAMPATKSVLFKPPNALVIQSAIETPSKLVEALTSKECVLRYIGTGTNEDDLKRNPAAVCLFIHYPGVGSGTWEQIDNKGLARLISLNGSGTLVDLSVTSLLPLQKYYLSVFEAGDLSNVPTSLGRKMHEIATIETDDKGNCKKLLETKLECCNFAGMSMAIHKEKETATDCTAGIIARSAGLLQNLKIICDCTGKTLWEEAASVAPQQVDN